MYEQRALRTPAFPQPARNIRNLEHVIKGASHEYRTKRARRHLLDQGSKGGTRWRSHESLESPGSVPRNLPKRLPKRSIQRATEL
jgi:hypothetical protein